ncbi:hypothetical protein [Streptomyces sp. 840.1]|nr:hypothetical protein [Streptomyces sp. 840.1]
MTGGAVAPVRHAGRDQSEGTKQIGARYYGADSENGDLTVWMAVRNISAQ